MKTFPPVMGYLYFAWWHIGKSTAASPKNVPLIFPSSDQWEGTDGPWSTFNMGIGDPIQAVRCVPGITDYAVRTLSSEACTYEASEIETVDKDAWAIERCNTQPFYNSTRSQTYDRIGNFSLPERWNEEYNSNANTYLGRDNLYFGLNRLQELGLARQYIGEVVTKTYSVCVFGMAIGNVSSQNTEIYLMGEDLEDRESRHERPNLLTYLCETQVVPSCSYDHTAGSVDSTSVMEKSPKPTDRT